MYDWKYDNGKHSLDSEGDVSLDSGITSVVWRTLYAPYKYINGEYWGNRLWVDGNSRVNTSTESETLIEEYCLESLEYLVEGQYIEDVEITVEQHSKGKFLITCTFTDKASGSRESVGLTWNI